MRCLMAIEGPQPAGSDQVPLGSCRMTLCYAGPPDKREVPVKHQPTAPDTAPLNAPLIYFVAFVTGAIVMSFEMLGSRYLNPYFGSGIYTWAALISTVLAALT